MTNAEIYKVVDELGMIEHDEYEACSSDDITDYDESKIFEEKTSKDLIKVMNFVDDLCTYNDMETIKKFLTALIFNNK